ncbi:MAG: hypothetical protein QM710_05140 [Flavobacterium sp.]
MKKLLLLSALFISFLAFSQIPQGISYQAIALNGSGNPVASSSVRVKLSILDTSATGTVLYAETQLKTTNAQGLFNLVIGQGTVVSGVFASINWGTNAKYLKVEMDTTGGTAFTAVGTTQLLTVPYAMAAGNIVKDTNYSSNRDASGSGYIVVYTTSEAKGFGASGWYTTSLSGSILGSITSNNATAVYSDSEARAFNGTSWYTTSLSGTVKGSSASNSSLVVYTDSEARGFGGTGWYTTSLSGIVKGISSSNTNIVVYTDSEAKAFNGTSWYTTSLSGSVIGAVSIGNSVVVYTNSEAKGFNGTSWYTTSLSGTVIGSNN